MKKVLYAYLFTSIISINSKVEPPNYNFSIDNLKVFFPGSEIETAKKKYEKPELISTEGNITTLKFKVAQLRYKFPVFVQVFNGKVLDFYTTLPTYFLHDVFHQSLINRFKKQDSYKKIEENALYVWKNSNGNRIQYSGTCTITCFPLYLSISTNTPPNGVGTYETLLQKYIKGSIDK